MSGFRVVADYNDKSNYFIVASTVARSYYLLMYLLTSPLSVLIVRIIMFRES